MNKAGINQYSSNRKSPGVIIASWFGVAVCGFLLYVAGTLAIASLGAFRSCSVNNSGLAVNTCGKKSVDVSDLILLAIFAGVVILTVSALTHAIRITRRPS
ncbi:MAG: hypothetical protein JWN38_425 [Candidatus Saccharibacteria bacterium]|nr:hypothetical protein [Candidatus Saccharibacteria bacterium]